MTARLDHIVINARFGMDRAEDIFTRLGFTLTPRGHHTLGSINHLMMFATDYLELLGIAEADAAKRPEVANAPAGLNGLVFKTGDVDKAFARLDALGMAGDPPKSFSRPVTLSGGATHEARFRTVTARADSFPAGRLYFCEHLTPELLWRDEWQSHPNGVGGFCELVIVVAGGERDEAARLADLLEVTPARSQDAGWTVSLTGGFPITVLTREAYDARFGDLARAGEEREAFLGALALRCGNADTVRKFARDAALRHAETNGGRLTVAVDAFDTLLLFDA